MVADRHVSLLLYPFARTIALGTHETLALHFRMSTRFASVYFKREKKMEEITCAGCYTSGSWGLFASVYKGPSHVCITRQASQSHRTGASPMSHPPAHIYLPRSKYHIMYQGSLSSQQPRVDGPGAPVKEGSGLALRVSMACARVPSTSDLRALLGTPCRTSAKVPKRW